MVLDRECRGGMGLRRGHFSVKMFAKMKESCTVGKGRVPDTPLGPPMVADPRRGVGHWTPVKTSKRKDYHYAGLQVS